MVHEYKPEVDILEAIRQAEAAKLREDKKHCDWEDPEDVAFYRQERGQEQRKKFVEILAPTHQCPECKDTIILLGQWVISKDLLRIMCRSCFEKMKAKSKIRASQLNVDVHVFQEVKRYTINIDRFICIREASEISQREFARLAGWSRTYQVKLESGEVETVNEETFNIIMDVFKRCNTFTKDIKWKMSDEVDT